MRIVIDPGHGGKDPGAIGKSGLKEKDVNLAVGITVAAMLQQAGAQVLMTRNRDIFIELDKRAKIANDFKANYFISIHCNSATAASAHGTETYCYRFGGEGEKLAKTIQAAVVAGLGTADRGVKAANFAVLRDTAMPAALIEMAFISNKTEEGLLRNRQLDFAKAIAEGIKKYTKLKKDFDMEKIVLYHGDIDALAAMVVGQKFKAPVMREADYTASGLQAKTVIRVGGTEGDRFDSFKRAAQLL